MKRRNLEPKGLDPYREVVEREELPELPTGRYRRRQRCTLRCGHVAVSPLFGKYPPLWVRCKECGDQEVYPT